MQSLKMVVGLGNPGRRYENNRHNIGFRAIELYAERRHIDVTKKQSKALIGQGTVDVRQLIISKPKQKKKPRKANDGAIANQTDANQSGATHSSVGKTNELAKPAAEQGSERPTYRTVSAKVLLVKPQTYMNSSGESVQPLAHYYNIAPKDILVIHDHMDLPTGKLRLRPGGGAGGQNGVRSIINRLSTQDFPRLRIGVDRPPGRMDPAKYVLQDFQRAEAELFGSLADTVVQIIDTWLADGIDTAMNQFNGTT